MESYYLKCRKYAKNINLEVSGTSNVKAMILSKCAICSNKKSRFIKNQESKGLLSNLGLRAPLILFRMGFLMYVKRVGWGKITLPGLFLIGLRYQAYFWYITSLSYVV